jgi:hypothetical protein
MDRLGIYHHIAGACLLRYAQGRSWKGTTAVCRTVRKSTPRSSQARPLPNLEVWYERALKANPSPVLTWRYYCLCQIEQATAIKRTKIQKGRASLPGPFFFF